MNRNRLIREFIRFTSIDSPSYGEKAISETIRQCFDPLGLLLSEDDTGKRLGGGCGNLYGFLDGDLQAEPLLFSAHMDTVEPCRSKCAAIGEDGRITSGGSTILGADDCAGIVVLLEALRTIQENGLRHRPIEVLFTVAEENYCEGASCFDFSKLRSKQAYILDLSGPVGTAAYRAPTVLSFNATVRGKSSHAGFEPEKGIHAIAAATHAVSLLSMGHADEETTLNVGTISGGIATNIVPDRCIVTGEIRSFSHGKALKLAEEVKQRFQSAAEEFGAEIDFTTRCGCVAYETPLDHPVAERFRQACEGLGLTPAMQSTFGGSDNNTLMAHGIVGLVLATAMNNCHSCEEYSDISELSRAAELTVSLMTSGN